MTRIESEAAASTVQLGSEANDMAIGDGVLWVTVRAPETSHRGGTLTAWALNGYLDSLDPALAYSPCPGTSWPHQRRPCGFPRVGGLEGATLSRSGSVVARTDRRWHDVHVPASSRSAVLDRGTGCPEDFRRAIERVFANLDRDGYPSGGVPYFSGIVGAQAASRSPKPCDLSGGIITDNEASTVTFHLSALIPTSCTR